MADSGADITENDDAVSLREFIVINFDGMLLRIDHLDAGIHDLQQRAERIEKHLEGLQAQIAEVQPLLDRWKNSGIAKLAAGRMPWG